MYLETKGVLFLKAEEKSFKKGEDTIHYVNATVLDSENVAWEMSVATEIKDKVLDFEPRTECDVVIELYKTKFEGKEQVKLRLQGIE